MSFKITRAAIHNPNVSGSHKLVLIIIADHEGGDFGSWASVSRIATLAGLKRRQTQNIIHDLERMGELLVLKQDGHHGTNRYFVVNKVINRGALQYTGGAVQCTGGVHSSAPEHIKNSASAGGGAPTATGKHTRPIFNTPQGEAPAIESPETETNDTPNYIPPRCLHNVSQSALKCNQCKEAFMKGELQ
jgi:hypothetical protein